LTIKQEKIFFVTSLVLVLLASFFLLFSFFYTDTKTAAPGLNYYRNLLDQGKLDFFVEEVSGDLQSARLKSSPALYRLLMDPLVLNADIDQKGRLLKALQRAQNTNDPYYNNLLAYLFLEFDLKDTSVLGLGFTQKIPEGALRTEFEALQRKGPEKLKILLKDYTHYSSEELRTLIQTLELAYLGHLSEALKLTSGLPNNKKLLETFLDFDLAETATLKVPPLGDEALAIPTLADHLLDVYMYNGDKDAYLALYQKLQAKAQPISKLQQKNRALIVGLPAEERIQLEIDQKLEEILSQADALGIIPALRELWEQSKNERVLRLLFYYAYKQNNQDAVADLLKAPKANSWQEFYQVLYQGLKQEKKSVPPFINPLIKAYMRANQAQVAYIQGKFLAAGDYAEEAERYLDYTGLRILEDQSLAYKKMKADFLALRARIFMAGGNMRDSEQNFSKLEDVNEWHNQLFYSDIDPLGLASPKEMSEGEENAQAKE